MKLVVASDEKTHLTNSVVSYLKKKGYELTLLGDLIDKNKRWKWVDIGVEAAKKVVDGKVDYGIIFCWSGTGISMAANKVKGARAALCWDKETARLARKWDNANILCMSLRATSEEVAKEIASSRQAEG
ncbi:MAG: RpiB/LacA/LacB family sugar-phosphate isomerase [Patescibacteria group bacterium]